MKLRGALLVILLMSIAKTHGQENPPVGIGIYITHAAATVYEFIKEVCSAVGEFFAIPYRKHQPTHRAARILKNVTSQMLNKTGRFGQNGTKVDTNITGVNDNYVIKNVTIEHRNSTERMWDLVDHNLTAHGIPVP